MSVKVTGIHHIALKACGLEEFRKTVAFYQELLGLPVARAWGEGINSAVMLDTGAGLIEIFANGTDAPGQGAVRHVALQVENTDDCIEAVRRAGYHIISEPVDVTIPSNPPYPVRIAFCNGPVGEEIEFFQVK